MILKNILSEKKDELLASWFDRILDTYPAETAKFLKNQKDRFANPVGQAIHKGIGDIFQELLQGGDVEKVTGFLDNIIRVRAVQEFSASQAVAFIFFLKSVIRDGLTETPLTPELYDELATLESQIDSLALIAFDIFMQCREKLFDIKANEMKNMTYRLLQRANMVTEIKEAEKENNFIAIQKKEVNT
jgi:RsbT co-antagonist protein rsbRD N-terminal domain